MNTPEFYDKIYSVDPDKWNIGVRDKTALETVYDHIAPKSVLDVGCGNGHTLKHFCNEWPEAKYHGVDLSSEAVRLCKENVPQAHVVQGDYMEVSHPHVDLILIMGVAEHFLFLDRLFEKLKEEGKYIYLEAPNCLNYSNVKQEGYRETHNGSGQAEWHLERKSWEHHIEKAGLRVIESVVGKSSGYEFVWLLKSPKRTGHPVMDDIVPR